ncbi:MAG: hypothetical protein HQL06_06050 [Nitrospirae bacterium]|nr:hypothetical protein [Nitrospirota bacterium]
MCIVIDTNNLSCVFKKENREHADFEPVYRWIISGKGKIVYGGTTYERELEETPTIRKLFLRFSIYNKVVVVDKAAVDSKEAEYKRHVNSDFDDPHLVAIVAVSGVRLVCTNDKRAIPFLTNKEFYGKGKKPKIYSTKKNEDLLCDKNITKCCKPASQLNKDKQEFFV